MLDVQTSVPKESRPQEGRTSLEHTSWWHCDLSLSVLLDDWATNHTLQFPPDVAHCTPSVPFWSACPPPCQRFLKSLSWGVKGTVCVDLILRF